MIALKKPSKANMSQVAYDIILNTLYAFLSLITLVFLPLVRLKTDLLRFVPFSFYRKATSAVDVLVSGAKTFSPPSPDDGKKRFFRVIYITRGAAGFNELLEVIKANWQIIDTKVEKITLTFGQLPGTIKLNYWLYIQDELRSPIIIDANLDNVRKVLLNWIRGRAKFRIDVYLIIFGIIFVVITILHLWLNLFSLLFSS